MSAPMESNITRAWSAAALVLLALGAGKLHAQADRNQRAPRPGYDTEFTFAGPAGRQGFVESTGEFDGDTTAAGPFAESAAENQIPFAE